ERCGPSASATCPCSCPARWCSYPCPRASRSGLVPHLTFRRLYLQPPPDRPHGGSAAPCPPLAARSLVGGPCPCSIRASSRSVGRSLFPRHRPAPLHGESVAASQPASSPCGACWCSSSRNRFRPRSFAPQPFGLPYLQASRHRYAPRRRFLGSRLPRARDRI